MSFRLHKSILVTLIAVFSVVGFARVAHADPHAVFYTDRGQEQLFYNVLAALNQSDYVEPAEGQYSRGDILTEREKQKQIQSTPEPQPASGDTEPGFPGEQDATIQSTKTELSGILSRSITLEGHDLWTAYLVHQFALEVARRNDQDQLFRVYCERGIGIEGCNPKNYEGKQDELDADMKAKYVRDPVEWAAQPIIRGAFGVLLSGLPGYEEEMQETLEKSRNKETDPEYPNLPLAYNPSIAEWWKKASETGSTASSSVAGSNAYAASSNEGIATNMVTSIMAGLFPAQVIPEVWDYVAQNEQGGIVYKDPEEVSGYAGLLTHQSVMIAALNNNAGLLSSAQAGAAQIDTSTQGTTVDGSKATYELVPNAIGENGEIMGLHAQVVVPASINNTYATSPYSAALLNEREFVDTAQTGRAGDTFAVRETDRTDNPDGDTINLSPNASLVARQHEEGSVLLLNAGGYRGYDDSESNIAEYPGPDPDHGIDLATLGNTLSSFGDSILGNIGGGSGGSGGNTGGGGTSGGGTSDVCQAAPITDCISIFEQESTLASGLRCPLLTIASGGQPISDPTYSVSLRNCLESDDTTRSCMRDAVSPQCSI